MKCNIYGVVKREYYYNSYTCKETNMEKFNPDTFAYKSPNDYNRWDIFSNRDKITPYYFIKKELVEKTSFVKTLDIEVHLTDLTEEIKIHGDTYKINDIVINSDEGCYDIYTDYPLCVNRLSEEKEKEFLDKVKIYFERVEQLNQELQEKLRKEKEENNKSFITKLIDKIKGVK